MQTVVPTHIKEVSLEALTQIMTERDQDGLFFAYEVNGSVSAVDNTTGEAWTENLPDLKQAITWLERGDCDE